MKNKETLIKHQAGSVFSQEPVLISAPIKSLKYNEQETQEVIVGLANAKETSMHATLDIHLSEFDIIFIFK